MNGSKDYYLSEFAVSDKNGGGLSILRTLEKDIDGFDRFVHVSEFATRIEPILPKYLSRQLNLHELQPVPRLKARSPRDYLERAIARYLRIKPPLAWLWDRWSRTAADNIQRELDLKCCKWLVVPQSMLSVLVMNRLWKHTAVPYVSWVMDDHVVRWRDGWFYPPGFEAEFRFHLRNARKVFVISPIMQEFYRQRFGVEAEVLFGPADPVSPPVFSSSNPTGPVRLAYFGAIRSWQSDALRLLITNLEKTDATLDLFGFHVPPDGFLSPRVFARPPVPPQEVMSRMQDYDGVVIPASFYGYQRNLTELNIATKMSECYASGTVPVIVAPEYAAMAQFARQHGGALTISDFDDPVQLEGLRSLKAADLRKRILTEARAIALKQCSYQVMKDRWSSAWQGMSGPASNS